MDEDIRSNLAELGKHIADVGRMIASKKSTIESMKTMSEALSLGKVTLDTYIRIQQDRYAEV